MTFRALDRGDVNKKKIVTIFSMLNWGVTVSAEEIEKNDVRPLVWNLEANNGDWHQE